MTNAEALKKKFAAVKAAWDSLDKRSKQRPPRSLAWVAEAMVGDDSKIRPKDCVEMPRITSGYWDSTIKTAPADRLARSFCALEDFEGWIDRAKAGAVKHQAEIERQCASKLARMQTFAAMS